MLPNFAYCELLVWESGCSLAILSRPRDLAEMTLVTEGSEARCSRSLATNDNRDSHFTVAIVHVRVTELLHDIGIV